MANNAPFLSSLWQGLSKDEKVANAIRSKNLAKQVNGLDPEVLKNYIAGRTALGENPTSEALANLYSQYGIKDIGQEGVNAMATDPYHNGNALSMLGGYASAHPFKTAAGAGLGLMNVAGLTDNDYYGGQLAGLLAGGLGSKFLGGGFNPMVTMGAGALGSLFDKLRQKQAESRQAQNRY